MPGDGRTADRWRRRTAVPAASVAAVAAVLADKVEHPLQVVALLLVAGAGAGAAAWSTLSPRRGEDGTPVDAGETGRSAELAEPGKAGARRAGAGKTYTARGLPDRQPTFRGRESELAALIASYEAQREQREQGSVRGPVVLALHGPPGVGKSAIQFELARRLAGRHPDGVLFANLGQAAMRKSPHDVLHALLMELGWPEEEIRSASLQERVGLFRAGTAGRRILVVLDAARDADQLNVLIPNSTECTVLISSRPDLVSARGFPSTAVRPPGPDEALTILAAYSQVDDAATRHLAVELTELCGRLPIALRAAGDRVRHGGGKVQPVVQRLRPERSRLADLAYGGRSIEERLDTEYGRLTDDEKAAFCRLSLVEAASFTPWVIRVLMPVSTGEAANLAAALAAVGLLDDVEADASGFPRYTFHPLTRIFARRRLGVLVPDRHELKEIENRLHRAVLAACCAVLSVLEGRRIGGDYGDVPLPEIGDWAEKVAEDADRWISAELPHLVRAVTEAHQSNENEACWVIAAWLDCWRTSRIDRGTAHRMFELARRAAAGSGTPGALGRVLLAEGIQLLAFEEYDAALKTLEKADREARRAGELRLQAAVRRRIGQVWHGLRHYRAAAEEFETAARDAKAVGDMREYAMARLLHADSVSAFQPADWRTVLPGSVSGRGDMRFHLDEVIVEVRCANRRRDLRTRERALARLHAEDGHGLERFSHLHCELSSGYLWHPGDPVDGARAPVAGRLAAGAILLAAGTGREFTEVRARTLLARALLAEGRLEEARGQLDLADALVPDHPGDRARDCLRAMSGHARGELMVRDGQYRRALELLEPAVRCYQAAGDFWHAAQARALAGTAHRGLRRFGWAMAELSAAVAAFAECGDEPAFDHAADELAEVCAELGLPITKPTLKDRLWRPGP
ncbi:hypothetical protein GCM10010156_64030 [Planobispora rosea]|uniref:NB-ARC domain-containing protein n=1 Tax=Planobispora rosea TaxID=35762 RepID=A0A8J3S4K6_PLARO|nr:NB-ARC domain-containing protein [Planobispora rosea]GGS97031.1 hypothetical protein GCM10010156_64030 [Planobispora rosea]GIH87727.1 hypothetical protein Pro02_61350 [Planobispora rosea]